MGRLKGADRKAGGVTVEALSIMGRTTDPPLREIIDFAVAHLHVFLTSAFVNKILYGLLLIRDL